VKNTGEEMVLELHIETCYNVSMHWSTPNTRKHSHWKTRLVLFYSTCINLWRITFYFTNISGYSF